MTENAAPSARIRLYGHVRYVCFSPGCEVITEPEEVWWSDGRTVIEPPDQPPTPPNAFLPYCSKAHLPAQET